MSSEGYQSNIQKELHHDNTNDNHSTNNPIQILSSRSPLLLEKSFDQKSKSMYISINPDFIKDYEEKKKDRLLQLPNDDHLNSVSNHDRKKFEGIDTTSSNSSFTIPESVLQYERQMRKLQAADRAGSPVTKDEHLHVLYIDEYMIAVNKPSGVLCVPGVNHNPSMVQLVYDEYGPSENEMTVDKMIVHRLDMDTSGVVVFARTMEALKELQKSFRDRRVDKTYEALVCGRLGFEKPCSSSSNSQSKISGKIDLALQRDHRFPPFMRVATPQSEEEASKVVHDLKNNGWKKIIKKRPKPSTTFFEIISDTEQYQNLYPTTRLKLKPITGRTHQLRVHLAAIGHPIIGDPAYGIMGEASPNGGIDEDMMDAIFSPIYRAGLKLQKDINEEVQRNNQCMCLHAKILKVPHPVTGKMMTFEAKPSF